MCMLQRLYPLFLAVATLALLSGCGRGEASDVAAPAKVTEVPVSVAPARVADAQARHSGSTHLVAYAEANVTARVGGQVVAILAEEGKAVRAGEVIARLDGERLKLSMERAAAELDKQRQAYRRNVALHERGLVSQGAHENLRYDLDALEAAYQLARLQHGYTEIRAPIDGVISNRAVRTGTNVAEGDVLFRITNLDTLEAHLHVPQRELYRFSPGQPTQLRADAWPTETFPATVTRISPTGDAGSGTFRLTLAVPSHDGRLRPGMFTRLDIVYEVHHDALMIPAEAILDDDSEAAAVFVVAEGHAQRRDVVTGIHADGQVQVLSGLVAGEQVIVIGQAGVRDGAPISVRDAVAREI
jgi:membrane fusion protein, multidrug efflux system